MTSPDSATIAYQDSCSNGNSLDARGRREFVNAMLANPRSKLARVKAKLVRELETLGGYGELRDDDVPRGYEGVYLEDPILVLSERNGCGDSSRSYSYTIISVEGIGNSPTTRARFTMTIDDQDHAGMRTLKVRSIVPFHFSKRPK